MITWRDQGDGGKGEEARRFNEVELDLGTASIRGSLVIPPDAPAVVLFAHGSGSSRFSPRNRFVADVLNIAGMATLLADLLTPAEQEIDERTRQLRFDIGLLGERVIGAIDWLASQEPTAAMAVGLFGASTGSAAALAAAAHRQTRVRAIVSRGGRPDLAGDALEQVRAPTLLIVGAQDKLVIELNRQAMAAMNAECQLEIIPAAGHLFEEPGALEEVARLASEWFVDRLVLAHRPGRAG